MLDWILLSEVLNFELFVQLLSIVSFLENIIFELVKM